MASLEKICYGTQFCTFEWSSRAYYTDESPDLRIPFKNLHGQIEPFYLDDRLMRTVDPGHELVWWGKGQCEGQVLTALDDRRFVLWFIDFSTLHQSFAEPNDPSVAQCCPPKGFEPRELSRREAAEWIGAQGLNLPFSLMGKGLSGVSSLAQTIELKPTPALIRTSNRTFFNEEVINPSDDKTQGRFVSPNKPRPVMIVAGRDDKSKAAPEVTARLVVASVASLVEPPEPSFEYSEIATPTVLSSLSPVDHLTPTSQMPVNYFADTADRHSTHGKSRTSGTIDHAEGVALPNSRTSRNTKRISKPKKAGKAERLLAILEAVLESGPFGMTDLQLARHAKIADGYLRKLKRTKPTIKIAYDRYKRESMGRGPARPE